MVDSELMKTLQSIPTKGRNIGRTDFTWTPYTSADTGSTQTVATYSLPRAFALRDDVPIRIALPRYEQITDSSANSSADSISVSGDLIQTPAGDDVSYWADGSFQGVPGTIDYGADTFDHTDGGSSEELDVWYFTPAAGDVEMYKVAPSTGGRLEQRVFTGNTAIMNQRDQADQPVNMEVSNTPLHRFVPEDWELRIEVNLPYPIRNDDDGSRGAEAYSMLVDIPVHKQSQRVNGLSEAVKNDIVNNGMR